MPGLEQPLALVDLLELEHRARTPALGLGPLDERIGEMLTQPALAALGSRACAVHQWTRDRRYKRTERQLRFLRGRAHALKPVIQIGQQA